MSSITQRLREIAKSLAEAAAARRGIGLDKAAELYSIAAELEALASYRDGPKTFSHDTEVARQMDGGRAANPAPAADAVMNDESIMHLWDTRVGDPSAKYPLTQSDILCFARAIAGPLRARINALEARQAELQRISEIGRLAVPPENTPEAAQAIEAALVEYDYPANARNAARAGWRACRRYASTQSWVPLTDDDRTRAFQSLPDMLEGFMKTWGWLHFAKAIEAICREKNGASTQPDTSKEQS